ncbi:hypothetical protein [Paenibacillus glucanolyticus]|uniref:hypothetical protein n=1 Tax=Paenibacillus glucanolyticus TaxID=59843 RepID=UPI00096C843A|nr:hypothetical protein [Paenibacillus glucanolyticus]OMF76805.1 hypothetical protein BK142_14905 [Paenibacillus glucanolyticus]
MITMTGPSNMQYKKYSGRIWITMDTSKGFNVAEFKEDNTLRVLAYTQGNVDQSVMNVLISYGWTDHHIAYLLANDDELVTCQVCHRIYQENYVNIVDYETDVCFICQPTVDKGRLDMG